MRIPQTQSGEIVTIAPLVSGLVGSTITATVVLKTASLEVIRLVVPAGKEVANHTAPGEITAHCLEGAVDFTAGGRTLRLVAGQMLYLSAGTLHALRGVEDASILVTRLRSERDEGEAG